MATTFWAYCSVSDGYNQDTAKYVAQHWSVTLREDSADDNSETRGERIENVLGIEVHEYPEIMSRVEESGYFRLDSPIWQVNRISEQGITFYLVNRSGKSEDGQHNVYEEVFIFLPICNVIAIHNLSEQFFINESVQSFEKSEKPQSER